MGSEEEGDQASFEGGLTSFHPSVLGGWGGRKTIGFGVGALEDFWVTLETTLLLLRSCSSTCKIEDLRPNKSYCILKDQLQSTGCGCTVSLVRKDL